MGCRFESYPRSSFIRRPLGVIPAAFFFPADKIGKQGPSFSSLAFWRISSSGLSLSPRWLICVPQNAQCLGRGGENKTLRRWMLQDIGEITLYNRSTFRFIELVGADGKRQI